MQNNFFSNQSIEPKSNKKEGNLNKIPLEKLFTLD